VNRKRVLRVMRERGLLVGHPALDPVRPSNRLNTRGAR
jgi:hypothetical protein